MSTSFRQRQQQAREQAILEAAFHLLTARGYAAMTMDEVAGRVGISKATLYQHFGSKEELTAAVAAGFVRRLEEHLHSLDPRLSAVARLHHLMRFIIESRYQVEMAHEARSVGGFGQSLRPIVWNHPRFREQYERFVRALCALLDEAKASGEIVAEVPTRLLVQVMLSLTRDFDYAELLETTPVSAERLSDALTTIFLQGARPRRPRAAPTDRARPGEEETSREGDEQTGTAKSREPTAESQEPTAESQPPSHAHPRSGPLRHPE